MSSEEELGISIEMPRAPNSQRVSITTRKASSTISTSVASRASNSIRASYSPSVESSNDISTNFRGSTADIVTEAARKYGHDERLLHSIIYVESRGNSGAISSAGAIGLMQIMPATGARFGVSQPKQMLKDPKTNIQVGARYLSELKKMFNGDLRLVLAAYNAGEGSVMRYGNRIPPFAETQDYVRSVLARYLALNQCKAREGSCARQEVAIAR